mgnify:CR=1 FL=1
MLHAVLQIASPFGIPVRIVSQPETPVWVSTVMQLISFVSGFFLAIASRWFEDWYREWRDDRNCKKALINEFAEVVSRLTMAANSSVLRAQKP